MENDTTQLRSDWPRITMDRHPGGGREWLHPRVPRYYLHRVERKWAVIDRDTDFAVTRLYRRKGDCVRAFVRGFDPHADN